MAKLTPIDFDPFAPKLTPVDFDPFAEPVSAGEGLMNRARAGIGQTVGGTQQMLGETFGRVFDPMANTASQMVNIAHGLPMEAENEGIGAIQAGADEFAQAGAGVVQEAQAESLAAQQGVLPPASIGDALQNPGNTLRYYGGLMAESAPAMAAAMATRNPQLAAGAMGLSTAGQTYGAQRADGASPQAALEQAAIAAGMETGLGQLPLETAFGAGSLVSRGAKTALQEAGTESLTGAGQLIASDAARGVDTESGAIGRAITDSAIVGAGMGVGEAVLASPTQRGKRIAEDALSRARASREPPPAPPELTPTPPPDVDADARLDELLAPLEATDGRDGTPAASTEPAAVGSLGPVGESAPVGADAPGADAEPAAATAPVAPEAVAADPADYSARLADLRVRRDALSPDEREEYVSLLEKDRIAGKVGGRPMPGVRNMVAYRDAEAAGQLKPVQAYLDADNFKRINDELSHDAGDEAIGVIGQALREEFGDSVVTHRSGDEFFVEGMTEQEVTAGLNRARERLAGATLEITLPDGSVRRRVGVGFSYGLGRSIAEAENASKADKQARLAAGIRAERSRVGEAADGASVAGAAQAGQGAVDVAAESGASEGLSDERSAEIAGQRERELDAGEVRWASAAENVGIAGSEVASFDSGADESQGEAVSENEVSAGTVGAAAPPRPNRAVAASDQDVARDGVTPQTPPTGGVSVSRLTFANEEAATQHRRRIERAARGAFPMGSQRATIKVEPAPADGSVKDGDYNPETGEVTIYADYVDTPKRARWVAAHEITGHKGVRGWLREQGVELEPEIRRARSNAVVRDLAQAVAKDRGINLENSDSDALNESTEEALAELAAADETGDWSEIESRYGVSVPRAMRSGVIAALARWLNAVRRGVARIAGANATDWTEQDFRALVKGARRYVRGQQTQDSGDTRASTPASNDQTDTPAFRRWFGDSKVVDADGNPLVVYHGAPDARFATADGIFKNRHQQAGMQGGSSAFWFAKDKRTAATYADDTRAFDYQAAEPGIVSAYVSLQNPLIVDGGGQLWRDAQQLGKTRNVIQQARDGGHDGVIIRNVRDDYTNSKAAKGSATRTTDTYVVFDSRQIKSATGNSGAFDPANPSILKSVPKRTTAQETALTKAGLSTDARSTIDRLRDKVTEQWAELRELAAGNIRQRVFDRFDRMRAIEQDLGIGAEDSPYISARLAAGLPSIMEGVMLYGAPEWQGGALGQKDGTKGLLDALKPVADDIDGWLGWMVGRRAQALKTQGREQLMSDADIHALLSLAQGKEQAFKQAALDYLTIKNAVLDVAEKAGLIDPEGRKVWDSVEYIPFYRVDETKDDTLGPGTRKTLSGQSSGIRQLKGGTQNLADPLGNIIRNFTRLIDASLKNKAMLDAVDQYGDAFFEKAPMGGSFERVPLSQVKQHLLDSGVPQTMIDQMPQGTLTGLAKLWTIKKPEGDDVVRVMRNGRPEFYAVPDADLLRSLTSFKAPNKHWAIKPFIFTKRLLTAGVTSSPEFMLRNYIRDSGSAWVISDDKFRLGWDSVAGLIRPMIDDSDQRKMMFAGGSFIGGFIHGGSPDETAAALRRNLRKKGLSSQQIEDHLATVVRTPLAVWDKWQAIGSRIENANRNAVYKAAIDAGRSPKEAAYLARDLMDFSMQGDSAAIQMLADVLPFFNARLQGLYKLYRQGGKKKLRKALLARAGTITATTIGLLAWNLLMHGEGYDELEEWDKDTYWHIAPGTDYHVRIPKPFELGVLFATIPERVMLATMGRDRLDQFGKSMLAQVGGTLAMNPVPQGVMPMIELWANKSAFTGRPIHNMGDEALLPEAIAEWYTSDTAKLIAEFLPARERPIVGGLAASPKQIEHLWNGYTGTVGAYALDTVDWLVRQVEGAPERPELAWSELPLLKAIYRGDMEPRSTRYTTEFYDLVNRANDTANTIKEFELAGEMERAARLEAEWGWLLGERETSKRAKAGYMHLGVREINKARERMAQIRKEIEGVIAMPGYSDTEKRRAIDALVVERNTLAKQITTAFRSRQQSR